MIKKLGIIMVVLVFFTDPESLDTLAEIYIRTDVFKIDLENVTIFFYNSNTKVLYHLKEHFICSPIVSITLPKIFK